MVEARAPGGTGLQDRKVLLVEDDYLIASAMLGELEDAGALVIGPAASVEQALALIDRAAVDAAILDVNLNGETVFPVAEVLTARGIPFVFATGYSNADLPPAWRHIAHFEKPVDPRKAAKALFGNVTL